MGTVFPAPREDGRTISAIHEHSSPAGAARAAPPGPFGPFPVPARLARALAADGRPAEVLARCAAMLAARHLRDGPRAVRVVQDGRVVCGSGATGSAAVELTVAVDGRELLVRTGPDDRNITAARHWASWFLRAVAEAVGGMPALPPRRVVMAPFEAQVDRTPDAVAVQDENGARLTYRELRAEANRLAHHLTGLGAGPGTRVGICVERGIAQVVAIYAAVAAGAAYVPLDPDLPAGRLAHIAADADVVAVLADDVGHTLIGDGPWRLVDVGDPVWRGLPDTPPAVAGPPGALLHILYTSGTTGRPKGVAYPAAGVADHLAWMQLRYPFLAGDTALAKTSPGFDVSVWELFWPLQHGARLVMCRPGGHRDPAHLARLVARYDVTTIFLPPTVMAPFLAAVPDVPALRWALCGGEPVTPRLSDLVHATLPDAALVNCYGPTEAGSVTDVLLTRLPGAPVPLGLPAAHFTMSVLDEELRPVPPGVAGEAYIGSRTGLADGYWLAPARTAERFVADPHGGPGARHYRTGDLCRYRADGLLEHLGRIDRQLKIGGMRIEPGEIEAVLTDDPDVTGCAVLPDGEPVRLVAFVVPRPGLDPDGIDPALVSGRAAGILPAHMWPSEIVPVASIPFTVNGKIDGAALLEVAAARRGRPTGPADDRETALAAIVGDVLDVTGVGMTDTFAQLGGTSMTAATVLERCRARFGAIPEVRLLLTGTLREVAASVGRAQELVPQEGGAA